MLPVPNPEDVAPLGRKVDARAVETEALRRLPDDVARELAATGVFRMWIPTELDGHELSLLDGLQVLEELAYWDGSLGWCAMIGATTSVLAAFLPEEHARTIYVEQPTVMTVGVAAPMGEAQLDDDGLVASGRWAWGSGSAHAQWIGGGCRVLEPMQRPRALFVFFEREQVQLLDTWDAAGLRGSGSTDFVVRAAPVPEGRWVDLGHDAPRRGGALYRLPIFGLLSTGIAAVALGMGRRAVDELKSVATDKRYQGSRRTLAERPNVQAELAASVAGLEAARALLERRVVETTAAAERDQLEVLQRRQLRMASTLAVVNSLSVARCCFELAGGTAVYSASPLQRVLRDLQVASAHAMTAPRTWELLGRLELGLDTDVAQL